MISLTESLSKLSPMGLNIMLLKHGTHPRKVKLFDLVQLTFWKETMNLNIRRLSRKIKNQAEILIKQPMKSSKLRSISLTTCECRNKCFNTKNKKSHLPRPKSHHPINFHLKLYLRPQSLLFLRMRLIKYLHLSRDAREWNRME
jgi:hypothetical protein